MANKKVSDMVKEELSPSLNSYTELLIQGLLKHGIISKAKKVSGNSEVSYSLSPKIKLSNEKLFQNENEQFNNFKRIVTNIYISLNYKDKFHGEIPLSKVLTEFSKIQGIGNLKIEYDYKNDNVDESSLQNNIIELIRTNEININPYIYRILEYYTYVFTSKYFDSLNFISDEFSSPTKRNRVIDLVGKNKNGGPDILFEIKYRKNILNSLKETLFQVYEILKQYEKTTSKNSFLIMLIYTDENSNSFDKIKAKFTENLNELFPEYSENIFLIPVSINELENIKKELDLIQEVIFDPTFEATKFRKKPITVTKDHDEIVDTAFLRSPKGSFAVWIKLNPTKEYFNRLMNNEYVISHSTKYSGNKDKGEYNYPNVFAFSITPNSMDGSKRLPTEVYWKFWIANSKMENKYLIIPIEETSQSEWYHVMVRWNHQLNKLNILINGILKMSSDNYKNYWPDDFLNTAFIGMWGNRVSSHYLNLPLYRFISSSEYLDDEWLKKELRKRPAIISIDFMVGQWKDEWVNNNETGSETCQIEANGNYFVNGEHWFNIDEFKFDEETKTISFIKSSARTIDDRKMKNILKVESQNLLSGKENGYDIKYTRLI